MAARLESRGRDPFFVKMLDDYLAEMDLEHCHLVLDVGCGTGFVARRLANNPRFSGRTIGIDRSSDLTDFAQRQAETEGLSSKIEFRVGDAAALGTLKGRFDAAIAHTLISHVDDPLAVLQEIAACVRPGGRIAIFDGDFASWVFAGENPEAGRKLADAVIGGIVTNPSIMREFPRLIRKADLQLVMTKAYVLSEIGTASFFESSMSTYHILLPLAGHMDAATVHQLVEIQRQNIANGTFFGTINFYTYLLLRTS
jgi:ubiquinone/menaquinone biosynthesis C-methylase UbiE